MQQLETKLAKLKIVDAATLHSLKDVTDARTLIQELEGGGSLTRFQSELILNGSVENVRFDDYVLVDKLGEGGMGAVYKARSTALDRIEAIKMMTRMEDPNVKRRFQREAKLLARLEHPAIVPIYRIGRVGDTDYIAMKYVEGEDLKSKVDKATENGELLPIDQVCRWIQRAADALDHAHEQNIIHRDIKPHNLMITPTGDLIVLDMGIARFSDQASSSQTVAGMTIEGSGMGTPDYMPPEQWADARSVTPAADIYSLGCTLFFALTGRVPYPRERLHEIMRAHAIDPIPSAQQFRPEVPSGLDKVIARMMAKEPHERFRSAADVVYALEPFTRLTQDDVVTVDMRVESGSTERKTRTTPAPDRNSSNAALIAATFLFVAVLAAAGGVTFYMFSAPDEPGQAVVDGDDSEASQPESNNAQPVAIKEETSPKEQEPPPGAKTEPREPAVPVWIVDYQKEHVADWPELDELVQFVRTAAGSGSIAEAKPFVGEEGALAKATKERERQRIQKAAKSWVEDVRTQNRELWAVPNELDLLIDAMQPLESIETDEVFAKFQSDLTTELQRWRQPFDSLNTEVFGAGYTARIAETLRQLLGGVYALPKEENWQVIAGFENEQMENVIQAKVDEKVFFWFTITEPSYVTMVSMDEHSLFVYPIDKKWDPGNAIVLSKGAGLSFTEPGDKVFVSLATDVKPVELPVNTLEWKAEAQPILKMFPSKHTFDHVRRCLEHKKAIPGEHDTTVRHWAQTVIRLQVRE